MTRGIQLLEKEYGVPLLDRNHGRVEPTAFGRLLMQDARGVVAGLEGIANNLRQLADVRRGHLPHCRSSLSGR